MGNYSSFSRSEHSIQKHGGRCGIGARFRCKPTTTTVENNNRQRRRRCRPHTSQLTALDYIILEDFQQRLWSLGITENFVEDIRNSPHPREALGKYLDEFRRILERAERARLMSTLSSSTGNNDVRSKGPPPASRLLLDKLHTVTAAAPANTDDKTPNKVAEIPDDEEPCNICCEHTQANTVVKQLPCGHCFHETCIHSWLTRHCTCPVCRYELPTDDASYEVGRMERMKSRNVISSYQDEKLFFCLPASSSSSETSQSDLEKEEELARRSSWGVMDVVDYLPFVASRQF